MTILEETHRLRRDELVRLDGGVAGSVISCREGILWLTQTGNPGDRLIQAGETISIVHPGVVLISALEDSVCAVAGRSHAPCSVRFLKQALWRWAHGVEGVLKKSLLT
jgi:hypothetical protein